VTIAGLCYVTNSFALFLSPGSRPICSRTSWCRASSGGSIAGPVAHLRRRERAAP